MTTTRRFSSWFGGGGGGGGEKKIRDRTTSVLEKASHPLKTVAAKRKQKRATLF